MKPVLSDSAPVYFNEDGLSAVKDVLQEKAYSKIFVLVDENTGRDCVPVFEKWMKGAFPYQLIEIPEGEAHKNIETSVRVWKQLSDDGADRKSLLINLGGGVVTDLGGFVAATFRRGIDFINIPTSLLGMVDASLGGKTGVDLGVLKNQIGVIQPPVLIWIISEFLGTLPDRQMNNGYAEMLKHGLIADEAYWHQLTQEERQPSLDEMIRRSVVIKTQIVDQDLKEKDLRKVLNFGHTLGHAIESYFLEHKEEDLYHGEAIAAGMILEGFLSHQLAGMAENQLEEIQRVFLRRFPKLELSGSDVQGIIDLLKYDKKNTHGQINFVLLKHIGSAAIDINVPNDLLEKAFTYYKES